MSSTPPIRYFQGQPFRYSALLQCVCCALPATALMAADRLALASIALFIPLTLLLVAHVARRDPLMYTSLLVGTLPLIVLLRDGTSGTYSLPPVLITLGVLFWIAVRSEAARLLLHRRFGVLLMAMATLYWLASAVNMRDYTSNMRAMELIFCALLVFLLARHRAFIGPTLLSMAFSMACVAAVALPRGERLGMFQLDGRRVGNPQTFGSFATLLLIATFVDGGRWLNISSRNSWLLWTIRMLAGGAVLLSTSRSAWMVSTATIALICVYDNRRRLTMAGSIAVFALGGIALAGSGAGSTFEAYLGKTFNSELTIRKITTGRSEQWAAIPAVISDSPVWGFGPGTGRQIAAQYTGINLIWHALYLQITAELGLAGFAILILLLGSLISRCVVYARKTGELFPLVGSVGYALICFAVEGMDAASGCFLGIGLISFDFSRWFVVRETPAAHASIASRALTPEHAQRELAQPKHAQMDPL